MSMAAAILNRKSLAEIDREVHENPQYIKADKKFHKLVNKTLSKEKAQELDKLLDMLIEVVIKAYFREGEKFGERLEASLLID